jgi:serine/threonine-protein kinase
MSPEQATGAKDIDARSDVYSLGAMVYETLTGEPPHTGPTVQAVIAKLLTERPTRIRVVRETVPQEIDDAVAKALAKAPSDRFARAGDFAAALAAKPAPPRQRSRRLVWAAAGLAVALLAGILTLWSPSRPAALPPTSPEAASVAVLPFGNLTGNPADQYLSDGMTEEIIGQLARVGGLKVISRTSTEALKGLRLTMRQISDTLGVRHILEGSVHHEGNRIRVAVDLIDASTDAHVWTSRYDGDLTDVFALQEEIARQVADSLVKTVGVRPNVGRVTRSGSPEAYAAYLAGKSLLYRRTREGFRGAVTRFERAIAEDSTYAPAYAGLATVYTLWTYYTYPGIDFYDASSKALRLLDRAVALDSSSAEGYAARSRVLTRFWAPADEIEAGFKRALGLQPNSADVHQWYALFLAREGRHAESFPEAERAISLDPLAPGARIAGANMALAAGRPDVARQEADRALALEPGLVRARELRGLADLLLNAFDRCVALDLGPNSGARAMCRYSLGQVREAEQDIDSLRAAFSTRAPGDSGVSRVVPARALARYYAWSGNAEQSLAWLERVYAISPEGEDLVIIASGVYDKVRNDSRFKAGLQRIRDQIWARARRDRARGVLQ